MIETQNKMLFDFLMTGCSVTGLEALKMFGISSTPRRILDLKQRGINISDEWIEIRSKFGKKRVKKYFIKNKLK